MKGYYSTVIVIEYYNSYLGDESKGILRFQIQTLSEKTAARSPSSTRTSRHKDMQMQLRINYRF